MRLKFGVLLQIAEGLDGFRVAGFDAGVAEHVVGGRKAGILLNQALPHLDGTVVVLLEVQPLRREVKRVAVAREAGEQYVHGHDGRKQVAFLRGGQKIYQQFFVCGGFRRERLRFAKGGEIRLRATGCERLDGVGQREPRILLCSLASTFYRAVEPNVFILIESRLDESARFGGLGADRKSKDVNRRRRCCRGGVVRRGPFCFERGRSLHLLRRRNRSGGCNCGKGRQAEFQKKTLHQRSLRCASFGPARRRNGSCGSTLACRRAAGEAVPRDRCAATLSGLLDWRQNSIVRIGYLPGGRRGKILRAFAREVKRG